MFIVGGEETMMLVILKEDGDYGYMKIMVDYIM
jgi:hypothetical protein